MKLIFILAVLLIFTYYCASAQRPRRPRRPPRPPHKKPFTRLSSVHKDGAAKYCTHFGADITPYTTDPFVSECKCLAPGLLSCGLGINTIEPQYTTCKQKSRTTWMLKDGCNWCYCDNGSTYCSSMKCETKKKLGAFRRCRRGGRWLDLDGCNWCFCDRGDTICTKNRCSNMKKLVPSDLETCKTMPQRSFQSIDNCNWCFCMDENSPICTKMRCVASNTEKQTMAKNKSKIQLNKKDASKICTARKRTPGKFLHEDGCNWCFCIGSKTLMCTIMNCPKPRNRGPERTNIIMEFSDRTLALSSKEAKAKSLKEMAQTCIPGSKFKEPFGCNWCNCLEDGVVVCDQKECNGSSS